MKTVRKILFFMLLSLVCTGLMKPQNYDYLIITPDVFLQNATWDDELLSLQTSRGFHPVIHTVYLSYTAEQIRGIIQNYYNNGPLMYVLLMGNGKTFGGPPPGGDDIQWQFEDHGMAVPEVDYLLDTYIPFWSVESNNPFDPNGTSYVPSDDPYVSGLTSHGPVYIGRAPVTSVTEANNYVSKLSTYHQSLTVYSEARNREIILNQDVTCPSNGCTGGLVTYLNNELINEHIPGSTTIIELNVSENNPPGCDPFEQCSEREQLFENYLNQGAAVISLLATAGGPTNLGGWYDINSSFNLTNKNTAMPFLIAPNCTQGAVHLTDFECVMRGLMVFNNGGIIGAIAPTHGSEQHANGYVLNRFNDLLFQDNTPTYGEIFKILKDELASNFSLFEYYYNSLTYFGDPSLVPSIYKHRSGPMISSATWAGNFVIDGTITVHSALTLTIKPNTNITFQNNSSLIVQGILNASRCEFNGGTGTWGSIYFFGTASTNSVLDNATVRNGGGIRCYSGANVIVKNSEILNCTEGVYIYNSQPQILTNQIREPVQNGINVDASGYSPLILHNTITKTSGNPTYRNYQGIIFANNTNGFIAHNDVSGFAWGSYIGGGSDAIFSNSSYQQFNPNNRFRDNNIGIGAGWGGTLIASTGPTNSRFNSIYNNSVCDARSYQYSYLYARNNWWGTDGAQAQVDGTSLLDAANPLFSDPWNPYEEDGMDIISINNNPEEGGGDPDSSILAGLSLERDERIAEAILHYKRMVSDNVVPGFALGRLVGIKNRYHILNIREYLEILLTGNRPYRPVALALFAGILMGEDKYEQAMFLYNKIISDYPGSYHSVNALFAKFFAALNYENNRVLAGELLQELEALNLEDEEYLMRLSTAQNLFSEGGTEYLGKSNDQIASNQQTELPKEYSLLGNYPNPFNPSTNISYTLPYSSSVELVIYDIMGREVKSFIIDSQPSGYQTLIWNGTNEEGVSVSSGVYLYRMKIKSLENNEVFVKSSKLMLLK